MLVAFLAALVFFHSSEFLLALWSTGKPDLRSPDSHAAFLVSRENLLAMAATLTEYALETALFPALKRRLWPVAWVGGRCCWRGKRSSICTSYFALSTCDTLPRCLCSHAPPSPLHPTPPLFFPSPNPPFPSSNPSYEQF
ncbi:unnamed protein product [Closterium sp. NIES-64]|nr:unnamed protein product [Closterium sp. NIES-64]